MSYYYKDKNTGNVYSNVSSIEGAKEIKTAYRYKTLLQPIDGIQYNHQSFYIKDGSLPIFAPKYKDNEDIIENFSANYSPIMQVCISSISGKYHLSNIADGASLYYIPKNTTPMLYKTEMFKRNQDLYEPEISLVNYKDPTGKPKGGKVSWRVSEKNLKYFNPTQKGPNLNICDENTSATILNYSFRQNFCTNPFVYIDENTTTAISPSIGHFIGTKPEYNEGIYCSNAFGFNIPTLSGHYSAPHFTLNINDITANGYTNLNVKIDGLYLYANNCFGEVEKTSIIPDIKYIRNGAAFNSKYCQGLFYAINNDPTWDIDTITTGDYLGNGIIFSNLKESTTSPGKLEVKNPSDYNDYSNMCEWKYIFNDTFISEKQSLDDSNVWNHMVLQDVADNKMYSNVDAETGVCPNYSSHHINNTCWEECSYCKNKVYHDTNDIRYLECKNINNESLVKLLTTSPRFSSLTAKHTASTYYRMTNNVDEDVIGLKVPVYTAESDTNPYGYLVCGKLSRYSTNNYITSAKGSCCDGTGFVKKLSGTTNSSHWITHHAGDGWNEGEKEYIQYYTNGYNGDNKPAKLFTNSTLTTACPYCNNPSSNSAGAVECYCSCDNKDNYFIKTTDNKYALGKIKDKLCSGSGTYYPYKNNCRFYKFKFYGKDINKAFEGYIESTDISGLSSRATFNENYEKKDWSECSADNWNLDNPTTNKNGCYSYEKVEDNELTNYREIIFGNSTTKRGILGAAVDKDTLSSVSSNWLLYSYTGNTGYYYYYGHYWNPTMGRMGIYNGFNCDLMYKCTDGSADKFGNLLPQTAQEFKSEGYTPSAGTNYTISNVILTANIDLTTANGDYLHLCYPYVTVLNNPSANVANAGIITQMIMTYEAE